MIKYKTKASGDTKKMALSILEHLKDRKDGAFIFICSYPSPRNRDKQEIARAQATRLLLRFVALEKIKSPHYGTEYFKRELSAHETISILKALKQ